MKYILVFFLLFTQFNICFTQDKKGYFGHRSYLQLDAIANNPLFYNLYNEFLAYQVTSSNTLINKTDFINYGVKAHFGFMLRRDISIGLSYAYELSNAYPENVSVFDGLTYQNILAHEMLDVRTQTIIPKFEFGTDKALLPMGLTHQFGFGISFSTIQKKDYLYEVSAFDSVGAYTTQTKSYNQYVNDLDPIDFENVGTIMKYVVTYGLNMRIPITTNTLINYGFNYMFNFGRNEPVLFPDQGNNAYTQQAAVAMSKQRNLTFINFNFGLIYML